MLNDDAMHHILSHLDEPTRILGLTLDDCLIGGLTVGLVMFSSCKILLALAGYGIRTWVRHLKKGHSPNHLLLLMYWYLPHRFTGIFLKKLPKSHERYWVG